MTTEPVQKVLVGQCAGYEQRPGMVLHVCLETGVSVCGVGVLEDLRFIDPRHDAFRDWLCERPPCAAGFAEERSVLMARVEHRRLRAGWAKSNADLKEALAMERDKARRVGAIVEEMLLVTVGLDDDVAAQVMFALYRPRLEKALRNGTLEVQAERDAAMAERDAARKSKGDTKTTTLSEDDRFYISTALDFAARGWEQDADDHTVGGRHFAAAAARARRLLELFLRAARCEVFADDTER